MRLCTFPGCCRPHKAKGLCDSHRKQKALKGSLLPLINRQKLTARWQRVKDAADAYGKARTAAQLEAAEERLRKATQDYGMHTAYAHHLSRRAVPPAHPSPAGAKVTVLRVGLAAHVRARARVAESAVIRQNVAHAARSADEGPEAAGSTLSGPWAMSAAQRWRRASPPRGPMPTSHGR